MNIEEVIEKCKMFIKNRATIQTIQSTKEGINFTTYDTTTIETVLNELEKKDSIINEMAKFIAGLDIDELICKDREHCTGDYEYETCEECIKEYFTNKAENVGE